MEISMNFARKLITATAIAASLSLAAPAALLAADSPVLTMKPLQGVTFDVGVKHSVSYFLNDSGQCKLVMTLAGEPNWSDVISFTSIRFEASVPPGRNTRYNSGDGKAVEFGCQAEAQAMTVRLIEEVATDASR
jgi:hypothetical protein